MAVVIHTAPSRSTVPLPLTVRRHKCAPHGGGTSVSCGHLLGCRLLPTRMARSDWLASLLTSEPPKCRCTSRLYLLAEITLTARFWTASSDRTWSRTVVLKQIHFSPPTNPPFSDQHHHRNREDIQRSIVFNATTSSDAREFLRSKKGVGFCTAAGRRRFDSATGEKMVAPGGEGEDILNYPGM